MKVNFNQTSQINSTPITRIENIQRSKTTPSFGIRFAEKPQGDTFNNVSFGMNPDRSFLLSQSKKAHGIYVNKLRGIYSNQELIDASHISTVYKKIAKCSNAQSAVNFLQNYYNNMFGVEQAVFNLCKEAEYKGKRGFQEILDNAMPASLENLKQKQILVLDSTEDALEELPKSLAQEVLNLRNEAVSAVVEGSFRRSAYLEKLLHLLPKSGNPFDIPDIYRLWYKLPTSIKDFDAFVVKYHDSSHQDIATRLISASVATVDHIKAKALGGEDKLGNMGLEAAKINSFKGSMLLGPFRILNPELNIRENTQRYINDTVREINRGNSSFVSRSWYPESIQNRVSIDTGGDVILNVPNINISKTQKRQNDFTSRLSARYTVFRK